MGRVLCVCLLFLLLTVKASVETSHRSLISSKASYAKPGLASYIWDAIFGRTSSSGYEGMSSKPLLGLRNMTCLQGPFCSIGRVKPWKGEVSSTGV